jgi:hypothetical protein
MRLTLGLALLVDGLAALLSLKALALLQGRMLSAGVHG